MFQGRGIYGVKDINIKRDGYGVKLIECGEGESTNSNKYFPIYLTISRWLIEDVEFVDEIGKQQMTKSQVEQVQVTNLLLELLQKLI